MVCTVTLVASPVAESSDPDGANMVPAIAAGIAIVLIFVGLTIFVIIIFLIWYKRHKGKLVKFSTSVDDAEAPVRNNCYIKYDLSMFDIYSPVLKLNHTSQS